MTFASPWIALLAAAVAIPALLLLYFLKLRRVTQRIPSTLLWAQSFEDLEVNAPFQRLRYSLLLLLQLLALIMLLIALAQPRVEATGVDAGQIIMLIDRSASMRATDAPDPDRSDTGRTRLDAAKADALALLDSLDRSAQAMVIAVGATSRVVAPLTSDRRALRDAVSEIEPTDEEADLNAGLELASAFSFGDEESIDRLPDVVLFSDGVTGRAVVGEPLTVRARRFIYERIGPAPAAAFDNIGIVSFSARRDRDDPSVVRVIGRLINCSESEASITVTLRDGETVLDSRAITMAAAGETDENLPGDATVRFEPRIDGGAVLTLSINRDDALVSDNVAAVVLPPPTAPTFLVVHGTNGPDPFLLDPLEAFEPQQINTMSLARYEITMEDDPSLLGDPSLIIFDRVRAALPRSPSLTIGAVPLGIDRIAAPQGDDPARGRRIVSWDSQHPLMRHVSFDNVIFAGFTAIDLPATAEPIAYGPSGTVITMVRTRAARHVIVGFELIQSNWPADPSMLVFLQNVLDVLRQDAGGRMSLVTRPGEPVRARVAANAQQITIRGPVEVNVRAASGEMATLPPLPRVGLYAVGGAQPPWDVLAVSLLSDVESDIRTRDAIDVNARQVAMGMAGETAERDIWHWFVIAALALLALEWLIYCRKVGV